MAKVRRGNMKKVIVVLIIVLILCVFVSGCRKSIGDRIAENVLENNTDADVDISGDGKNVTIETDEGTISTGEDMKWPGDAMGNLPEPDAAIIGFVDNGDQGCSVAFGEMSKADAEKYVEFLKDLGYTENPMSMSDDNSIFYMGSAQDGAMATLTYTIETGEGMIAYTPASEE